MLSCGQCTGLRVSCRGPSPRVVHASASKHLRATVLPGHQAQGPLAARRVVAKRPGDGAACKAQEDDKSQEPKAETKAETKAEAPTAASLSSTLSDLEKLLPPEPEPEPAAPAKKKKPKKVDNSKIGTTLSDLDALLGVEEEEEEEEPPAKKKEKDLVGAGNISVSSDVLKQVAEAESARVSAAKDRENTPEATETLEKEMEKIVSRARQVGEDGKVDPEAEAALMREVESLLQLMGREEAVPKEDIAKIKERCFGPTSFWVTETKPLEDGTPGILVRGNLRTDVDRVFTKLTDTCTALFGDKYEVIMVEDPDADFMEEAPITMDGKPRIAFEIIPTQYIAPRPAQSWQNGVGLVLFFVSILACLELGAASNVLRLPPETLAFFANPDNAGSDLVPPGLEKVDPIAFIGSSLQIAVAVLGMQLGHEIGHRVVAFAKKVSLGPSLIIPSTQVGLFGCITQIKSMLNKRADLWQIAVAGPAVGGFLSFAIFIAGLLSTQDYYASADGLNPNITQFFVPVPTALFQSSFLLGGMAKLSLSADALSGTRVFVDPMVVAGWCGLTTNALNMLPAGALDGARMTQAAFGRNQLALAQFFTFVALAFGWIAGPLSLPFGLYLLICQREAEKLVRDTITEPSQFTQTVTLSMLLAAVLILTPLGVDPNDVVGPGGFV